MLDRAGGGSVLEQRALFRLVLHNRQHLMAQMPMRICHPPLEGDKWREKTGSDPKNWPWSYHNGEHWPSLLWYLGGAILQVGKTSESRDQLLSNFRRILKKHQIQAADDEG